MPSEEEISQQGVVAGAASCLYVVVLVLVLVDVELEVEVEVELLVGAVRLPNALHASLQFLLTI